jgi:hypothetical protein
MLERHAQFMASEENEEGTPVVHSKEGDGEEKKDEDGKEGDGGAKTEENDN